jgi:hypothetical protein
MSRVILCIKKFSICPQQFKLSIACLSLRSQIWKRIFKLFLDVETDHVETKILNRITMYRKVEEDHPEITTEMEHKISSGRKMQRKMIWSRLKTCIFYDIYSVAWSLIVHMEDIKLCSEFLVIGFSDFKSDAFV